MIIIYISIILLLCVTAFYNSKNTYFWLLGGYQISSYIILISLLVYNIIISINYSLQANLLEKAGYYIVLHLRLRITDVVVFYNMGNLLLLCSCVVFLIISDKKITLWKLLLLIPPVLYFIANHPRFKYMAWNYCMIHGKNNPFNMLVIINTVLLIIYFLLPLIQIVYQYRKTKIFSRQKFLLSTAVYIMIIEITMGFVLCVNAYSNYYPLRYDVNSLPLDSNLNISPWFSANSMYTEILMAVAVIILIYILVFYNFLPTLSINSHRKKETSAIENDEMLKTIFHTYKNAFFAIERFESIVENNIKSDNEMVGAALDNIKTISHNSFMDSKRMLDSIILTYDFKGESERLNLKNILNDSLLQYGGSPNLTVEKSFTDGDIFVTGSRAKLTEAFTNIVNNAAEATVDRENPIIRVSLFTENNQAVINFFDNGRGIPHKKIKKIFRPLYSDKQSTTNLGIGLSTTLKIISYHCGTITCRSKPNKYTIFQVVLPLENKVRK